MNIEDVDSDEKNVEEPLKKIFDKQRELLNKYKDIEIMCGGCNMKMPSWPFNLNIFDNQRIIKDFKQRVLEEVAEGIEGFRKNEIEHFHEELIDALHFAVELAILSGKDYDFFKPLSELKVRTNPIIIQNLYYKCGVVMEKFGLLCNTLKNKPWKQTQMKTDQYVYFRALKTAFDQLTNLLGYVGMSADDIYNCYFKKHKVNQFRIESKY